MANAVVTTTLLAKVNTVQGNATFRDAACSDSLLLPFLCDPTDALLVYRANNQPGNTTTVSDYDLLSRKPEDTVLVLCIQGDVEVYLPVSFAKKICSSFMALCAGGVSPGLQSHCVVSQLSSVITDSLC